jgi:hypothetical protein
MSESRSRNTLIWRSTRRVGLSWPSVYLQSLERDKMASMFFRSSLGSILVLAFVSLVPASLLFAQDQSTQHLRKYKAPPPPAHIEVTVLRDYNGKPLEDAHVIFHPIEGEKDKGYLELKTNEDGKAIIDVLPIGDTVRVQIIANGYQTYGQDYKVDKPEMAMEIRMKRPGAQYSIYKDNSTTPKSGNNSGSGNSSNPGQNSAPPPSSGKP